MSYRKSHYKGTMNKITLIGGLKEVPKIHQFEGGSVSTISLATKYQEKNKATGEYEENTEWHRIVLFNELAEKLQKIGHKGMKLYIEGPLQYKGITTKEGKAIELAEIVANVLEPYSAVLSEDNSNS